MMARTAARLGGRPARHFQPPFFHQDGTDDERQSRAERWFDSAVDAWVRDGRLTVAEAQRLREQLAEPQFIAVLPHFGVHLAIGAILRFPLGSIMRVSYVLLNLLLLTRQIDRRSW